MMVGLSLFFSPDSSLMVLPFIHRACLSGIVCL